MPFTLDNTCFVYFSMWLVHLSVFGRTEMLFARVITHLISSMSCGRWRLIIIEVHIYPCRWRRDAVWECVLISTLHIYIYLNQYLMCVYGRILGSGLVFWEGGCWRWWLIGRQTSTCNRNRDIRGVRCLLGVKDLRIWSLGLARFGRKRIKMLKNDAEDTSVYDGQFMNYYTTDKK